jgi:hypothetical protein
MKRIKSFEDFSQVNEAGWGDVVLGTFGKYMRDVEASAKPLTDKPEKVETTAPAVSATGTPESPDSETASAPIVPVSAADTKFLNAVPGNDDFILYMQHQQGVAGAKGLLASSSGVGSIHPETLKKKGCSHLGTVPYANLQCNIPSDKPQYKKDIVDALNKGDQRKGASLFLKMWKEKWNERKKQAQQSINDPKNAAVKSAIDKYCKKYGVPYEFAYTVANIESGFNPKSGNKRYKGLFALSQDEFKKFVPAGDIFNIDDNANAGVKCLKTNIQEFTKYLGPLLAKVNIGAWAKGLG